MLCCVGLYHPKNACNVGAVLRAAEAFGANMVVTTGRRYRRALTDVNGAVSRVPLLQVANLRDAIPFGCVPVAVEILEGAQPLAGYAHPRSAFYVFGPEDGTLGTAVTSWCRDVVCIPATGCLNLAAAVNVVLYDRAAKMGRKVAPKFRLPIEK